MNIRLIGVVCLIGFSLVAFAQRDAVSLTTGYGKMSGQDFSRRNFSSDFNSLGIRVQRFYSITQTDVYFSESFESIRDKIDNEKLQHLKTEVGANLDFGRKLYFIIGVGLNAKVLIRSVGYSIFNEFRPIVIGGKFSTGLGFRFSSKFFLDVLYHYQFEITPIYVAKSSSPGGGLLELKR